MKRNGKNIILSDDITIKSGTHQGENLEEILERQDSEIEKLKSNVKWIYKYGGVGSGRGGGPDTSSWSIYARLGENFINGETIILPKKGLYKLEIRINNPSGGTFKVTYTYSNSGSTLSRTATLNIDNSWTLEEMISLDSNSKITIKILDGNAEIKTVESNYITQSYTFGYDLVEENGRPYVNSIAFLEYIREVGLKVRINYSVIEGISSFKIKYKQFDKSEVDEITVDTTIEKDGVIELDAFSKPYNTLPADFIGKFSFRVDIEILGQTDSYEKILNIFPQDLYLLAEPTEGEVYKSISQDLDNIHKYYIGTVNFYITAFNGSQNSGNEIGYSISTKTPDSDSWEEQASGLITEQVTTRVTLRFSTPGWNTIQFVLTLGNKTTDKTVYIYVKDFESNLNWYPGNLTNAEFDTYKNIFRVGQVDANTTGFFDSSDNSPVIETITMTTNSEKVYLKPKYTNIVAKDCLFCAGIQYNSTSNSDIPILEIVSSSGGSYGTQTGIKLYQNRVEYGNTPVGDIYIGTELDNYDKERGENYHLVSIYRRYVCSSSEGLMSNDYYELCVYIDGVLETALSNYTNTAPIYTDIILYPNNYFINTLELSYFPHGNIGENIIPDYLTDTGIVHYWYSYKERILNQGLEIGEEIVNLLNIFEGTGEGSAYTGQGVYLDGSHIAIRSDNVLAGIVRNSKVPVMMISYDEINAAQSGGFFTWSEQHYKENEKPPSQKVGVYWSSGITGGNTTEEDVRLQEVTHRQTEFSLSVQGSTTKLYSSKNYTLKLNWIGEVHNDSVPLFSPNFNPEDSKTFLPEQAFTLKADVVDSGHSNNTCMGSFINSVTQRYSDSILNHSSGKYSGFVKNCLEGFPFLLFVRISNPNGDTTGADKYYYLGIYNFNLGRNSYFNLGYSDVSLLPDIEEMNTYSSGFCFCDVGTDVYNLKSSFTCAEIAYNSKYYDFSSYHDSILFAQDNNDKSFMFDDIHTGRVDLSLAQRDIAEFVKATTRAGGYLFQRIGKNLGEHTSGYNMPGQVPDYRNQYKEVFLNGTVYQLDHVDQDSSDTELLNYVEANDEVEGDPYTVDYQSLIEYYTICMVFGLVDSVQKNLTIKTWNGKRFYFAFYDMDTCLGIDNNGDNSTYYAFSDYWLANLDKIEENLYLLDNQVTVYRDYFDDNNLEGIKGFDIPSSYAFAVAKYFKSVTGNSNFSSPQSLWAKWRNKTNNANGYGFLSTADKFIDEFYLGYMKNVNELMFNYNYRQKYLRHTITTTEESGTYYGYDTTDISKFHGRRTEYIRDWLNGRFHIMDAYLNLPRATVSLKPTESNFAYVEQMPETNEIDTENKDIFVNRDIFSSGVQSSYGDMSFIIQAPDYSPLIISMGDIVSRYLLPDSDSKYKLDIPNTGGNKVTLGGSALWTYLDSINSFISNPMTISSTRLKNISGDVGTVGTWYLTLPALQTLELNSPGYTGSLKFDASVSDSFPNLRDIDISFSNINLRVVKESVKTINLKGVGTTANTAPSVNISECNKLNNVIIEGTRLNSLTVSPVWTDNLKLTGNSITNIDLRCPENKPATLTISDTGLEVLRVHNFSEVNIVKCPNLKEISINGRNLTQLSLSNSSSAPNLESVYIEEASNLTSLSLNGCFNLHELTLSGNPENITSLNLNGTNISTITYSSDVSNSSTYLYNNTTKDMLDLTPMTSLRTLRISENSSVEVIKLRNDPDQPVDVYAAGRVDSPYSKLIRIFGHIKITNSGALARLHSDFRIIHGTSWNGISFGNKTPLQILAGISDSNPPTSTTLTPQEINDGITLEEKLNGKIVDHHTDIVTKFGTIITNLKSNLTAVAYNSRRWFVYKTHTVNGYDQINPVDSEGCTNISFGNSADKYKYVDGVKTELTYEERTIGADYLSGICANTKVSQFDIYYVLNAFAISAARCGGIVENQSLSLSFWYSGGDRFSYDNPPNRYMFYGCSKITGLGIYCISTGSVTTTRLYSPSHSSSGEILCDNGLYSPLTGLSTISNFMSVNTVYISKYLFRRTTGNANGDIKYNISEFSNFTTSVICDKVDTYGKSVVDSSDKSEFGDLSGFFDDIKDGNIKITSSFSPNYLNFNTLVVPSKNPVTSVTNSFNPTSGYGTINLERIFESKGQLSGIVNSFKIDEASTAYQSAINSANNITGYDTGGKVLFPITENMFDGFTNLKYIGANDESGAVNNINGLTIITYDSSKKGSSETVTGFRGSGLLKYINQEEFPYLIFRPLGSNLQTCSGFLAGLTTYNGGFGTQEDDRFEFPKNLFKDDSTTNNKSNINLRDIAAFLKNCKIPYTLTGDGFSVCTKLQNITELFYGSMSGGDVCSKLIGSIPPRLFYHGIRSYGNSKTYYGTNEEIDINNPSLSPSAYYGKNEYKVTIPGKPNYNRNIRYAYAAFRGCAEIQPYEFKIGDKFGRVNEGLGIQEKENINNIQLDYINSDYTYWKYIATSATTWKNGNTKPLDISLVYDGNSGKVKGEVGEGVEPEDNISSTIKELSICKEDFNTTEVVGSEGTDITAFNSNSNIKTRIGNTVNFFCPPDLFSYFENSSNTNIQYMFSHCGLPHSLSISTFTKAMTGRICPYLLDSLSSIRSLAGTFRYCSGLSSVKYMNVGYTSEDLDAANTYLIPPTFFNKTPNITILASAFSGMYFEKNPTLQNIFYPLRNSSLDIRGIFAWCGYVGNPTIARLFSSNKLTYVSGAFSALPINLGENHVVSPTGEVYVLDSWRRGPSFQNNFPQSIKNKSSETYYVYYGYSYSTTPFDYILDTQDHHNYGS